MIKKTKFKKNRKEEVPPPPPDPTHSHKYWKSLPGSARSGEVNDKHENMDTAL